MPKYFPAAAAAADSTTILYDWTVNAFAWHTITTADGGGGYWNGFLTSAGTYSYIFTTTNYTRGKYTTTGADNARAGWITNDTFTRANLNPRTDFKVQVSFTNVQTFVGFVSGTAGTLLDLDTIGNGSIVGLWVDTTGGVTTFKSIVNDASGGGTKLDLDPTTTLDNSARSLSVYTDDEGVSWHIIFANTDNLFTTDLPAVNAELGFAAITQVNTGAAATNFEQYYVQFKHT